MEHRITTMPPGPELERAKGDAFQLRATLAYKEANLAEAMRDTQRAPPQGQREEFDLGGEYISPPTRVRRQHMEGIRHVIAQSESR